MVEFKVGKCPLCGKMSEIIYSNNPLVPGLCEKCVTDALDGSDLKQADFFCRTYNLPFKPDLWVELYSKIKNRVFREYTKQFLDSNKDNLYYQPATKDWWTELNEEWSTCTTFAALLSKIEPIKQQFIDRCRVKWGANYNFEDYVQLENLLVSTLRANDITNPMQIDAIKKACKMSVALDHAIEEGDTKNIKELTAAYSSFIKNAQIDNVIAAANSDIIATVADLGDYIEKCGGQFKYYDNVERDIVDKTINDLKAYTQDLVGNATGLSTLLETMRNQYMHKIEEQAANQAAEQVSIEDLIKERVAPNADFDAELEQEGELDFEFDGDEDDNF